MLTPQAYIEARLARLRPGPRVFTTSADELHKHIVKTVLSKKFRKWAVDKDLLTHLDNAIQISFSKKEPIKFVMPFGGYKLWRLEEAPEADWAELFTMMFYAAWLKPIADAYEPGVWFDFSSDDAIVERLNNTPKADTEAYKESFNQIITFLEKFLPTNLKFTFTPVGSRYTLEEFNEELEEKIQEWMSDHKNTPPTLTDEERAMIDLNVKPTQELLSDPEWREKNKVIHDAYMGMSRRRPYTRTEDKILAFTKPLPKGVAIGTTKTSIAKFWAGVGALKRRDDSYIETVLSPSQEVKIQHTWESLKLEGLASKNFSHIRIL